MKKIKFILPFVALAMFSCQDYLDVNEPADNPGEGLITPDLALAAAQTRPYRTLARTGNIMGNLFMNNWGFNVNSFAVTNPEEFSLTINNNTFAGMWDGLYTGTYSFSKIIAHPTTTQDNHKAIAKILKSFYFQYLVDLYGDIPYFGAHQGGLNMTPTYDDDQVIYRDLVVQIEEAIAMIQNPVEGTEPVGAEDIVFQGDMEKWVQFGNTLKLRILLRQSKYTGGDNATYLANEFAELNGAAFLEEDAIINPGYSNNTGQQNPYFDMFYLVGPGTGTTPQAQLDSRQTGIFRQYRASKFIGDNLNGNPIDPRRGRLFTLVGGIVDGVLQGDSSQTNGGTAPLSISALGPGQLVSSEQDGYLFALSETKFLLAEAAHEGYLPGDAQTLFNEGIAASFAQLGAALGTYITDVNLIIGKGYGVGSDTEKLKAIHYQKNIALTGINALEAFIEHTRTGFIDDIPLATGAVKPNKPRRLYYPNSEIVGNAANVPSLTFDELFVAGAKTPFWYVDN